jgi:23S rRNA (uracil1939-C5)-methyltransferase
MPPDQCPHFGPCGGCQLQHLAYAAQLAHKREVLHGLLVRALGDRAPIVEPLIQTPLEPSGGGPWGFRHKASFVFGPDPASRRGGFVMGHYEAGSKRIVPVRECPVHAPRANRIAFALRDRLARAGIDAAGTTREGVLRHVIVRTSRDEREAVAMLVVTRNEKALRSPIRGLLASDDRPDGFYLNVHRRAGPYMIGDETLHLGGRTHVKETCGGAAFLVSPTAFFQTNPGAADALARHVVAAIRESAAPGALVLDLYAGSGLFALPLALAGYAVRAIEENGDAIRDGEANQRLNRIPRDRVTFVRARVEHALPSSRRHRGRDASLGRNLAAVVLDPPRQGCPPAVLDAVFRGLAPGRAVYVSCNPEALSAELPAILDAGYGMTRVQPVDMVPHTEHIETVVTLDRIAP